ncbi:MAG: dihydroorotate dehydrogenase electron transfer subunit [Sporolactobacillus sp.]
MSMREDMTVVNQQEIADQIYELKLEGEIASRVREPGQFVHILPGGNPAARTALLRRPISICKTDPANQRMTLIYRKAGIGTESFSQLKPGMTLNVLGPLGHGFPLDAVREGSKALIIGGGVGVPPLYGLSAALHARKVSLTHLLGFRSAKDVFYEEHFAKWGTTHVLTEDGSCGRQGLVTDLLKDVSFDSAFACGPLPMLRAVQRQITEKPLFLSLEQRMGCGIGACMACVVHTTNPEDEKGYRRVCCDGPVFPSGEVELC